MTEQIAVNHRALMSAADKLTRAGYDGDAYRFCEGLVVSVLADGFRPLDPPIPRRGPGASRQAIEAARAVVEQAVRAAKDKRVTKVEETA